VKKPSVFLAENTNLEVEAFLRTHHTIYIPVGATEQHGPHAPIGTDVLLPQEIARRVAERRGDALVAPPLAYCLSYPHRGFTSEFSLGIGTFMAVIGDLAVSFAKAGFRRIVFLNGHYDNSYALAYACAQVAERLPAGTRAFPFNYWDGLTPDQAATMNGGGADMHAGATETSMLLALDPTLVNMSLANREVLAFPETVTKSPALHTAFFFASPGSVWRATNSGTWGDATRANAPDGERYFEWAVASVINLMNDIERMFAVVELRSAAASAARPS